MYIKNNTKIKKKIQKYNIQKGGIESEISIKSQGDFTNTKKNKNYKIINYNNTQYAIRKGSKNLYFLNSTSGKQELGRKIQSSSNRNHPINKIIKGYIKYSSKEPKTTFTVIKKDGRYNLHKKIQKNNSSYISKKITTF
jgi:hypothetical protein